MRQAYCVTREYFAMPLSVSELLTSQYTLKSKHWMFSCFFVLVAVTLFVFLSTDQRLSKFFHNNNNKKRKTKYLQVQVKELFTGPGKR